MSVRSDDFSQLLGRWRKTQIYLDREYEWLMPPQEQDMFSEGNQQICPLFIVFANTPARVKNGLSGACLPLLVQNPVPDAIGATIKPRTLIFPPPRGNHASTPRNF